MEKIIKLSLDQILEKYGSVEMKFTRFGYGFFVFSGWTKDETRLIIASILVNSHNLSSIEFARNDELTLDSLTTSKSIGVPVTNIKIVTTNQDNTCERWDKSRI